MHKQIREKFYHQSKSTPDRVYETILYTDGSTSCNCPGWTRRGPVNGQRSCKHTNAAEAFELQRNRAAMPLPMKAAMLANRIKPSTFKPQPVVPAAKPARRFINLDD